MPRVLELNRQSKARRKVRAEDPELFDLIFWRETKRQMRAAIYARVLELIQKK